MEWSFVRDRSPQFYSRFLGVTVMRWPRPMRQWFSVRRGKRALFVVDVGRFEVVVG